MTAIKNQMKLSFMSIPENVPLARVTAAAFASQMDFTLEDLEEIRVAVSEAVSNSIIHGYRNDPNYTVNLICTVFDDALEIAVHDEGVGIEDISKAMQAAFSTESDRMGLGFTFMESFMEKLHVESEPHKGTRVTMVKRPQNVKVAALEEN
ncbi:MAG TPA: anti-sigma F factor [Desulfobacteria bacterium]|nr:anti-sigma F factor [Desulfobacteria bacterium]